MAQQTVNRAHAEAAREAVAKMFNADAWGSQPIVQEPGHWSDGTAWYVCWEEGPYEWTYRVPATQVPGLFLEPYNTFVLAVCLDD